MSAGYSQRNGKSRKKPRRARYQRLRGGFSSTPLRHNEVLTERYETRDRQQIIDELRAARAAARGEVSR